jgi:hypothetical protein
MAMTPPEFRVLCARWCQGIPPQMALEAASVIMEMIGEALSSYIAPKNPK